MLIDNTPTTLLILAGGLGSRYRGLKQVDGLTAHGESILEFSVFDALAAGFNKFVFLINAQVPAEFIERLTVALARRDARAHWVVQDKAAGVPAGTATEARTKPWGTGHAILCAAGAIAEPFVVINADDYYGKEVYLLARQALADQAINARHYQLMAFPVAATLSDNGGVSRGVCQIGPDGLLQRVEEQTNVRREHGEVVYESNGRQATLPPDWPVSMNFWLFHPAIFGHLSRLFAAFIQGHPSPTDEFYIPTAVQALMAAGEVRVRVQTSPSRWMGMTYPDDKAALVAFISQETAHHHYPDGLWN